MKTIISFLPKNRKGTRFENSLINIISSFDVQHEIIWVSNCNAAQNQAKFLYAVHVADVVIVDCTIPTNSKEYSVYPALTAQINMLNHIIVISENNPPLNITPYRGVWPKDGEFLTADDIFQKLPSIIKTSFKEDVYNRLPEELSDDFMAYQKEMEEMWLACHNARENQKSCKTKIMISYRNIHKENVEKFKKIIECSDQECIQKRIEFGCPGDFEVKVLPPASLCGADEALTPMRRWMLVGLLEDHIREVDEVWVFESRTNNGDIDYTDSWWTIAEMVMVAYINHSRMDNPIKIRIISTDNNMPENYSVKYSDETPYRVSLTDEQVQKIARLLSNTRPDTMGPECIKQVKPLKIAAEILRNSSSEQKEQMIADIRKNIERSIPQTIQKEEREKMIEDSIQLYSDPDKIQEYTNDDIFTEEFWNIISYQTLDKTDCYHDGNIDVDRFIKIPMIETGVAKDEKGKIIKKGKTIKDFYAATKNKGTIDLGDPSKTFLVSKSDQDRYLWLATRMGRITKKKGNVPGLERIPIFEICQIPQNR